MNKSISQDIQNEKQVSESIKRFFHRFHVYSALKQSNAYKKKGIPVIEVFQYLFLLIFSNRSMYMNLLTGKNAPSFAKDTVYRFMKSVQINWIRFTTILAARIIKNAIVPLDSEERVNVLTIDDSMFERCRSKKVELLAKVYTTQSMHTNWGSACLHSAGQTGAPLFRSRYKTIIKFFDFCIFSLKPDSFRLVFIPFIQKLPYSVFYNTRSRICGWLSYHHQPVFPHSSGH